MLFLDRIKKYLDFIIFLIIIIILFLNLIIKNYFKNNENLTSEEKIFVKEIENVCIEDEINIECYEFKNKYISKIYIINNEDKKTLYIRKTKIID